MSGPRILLLADAHLRPGGQPAGDPEQNKRWTHFFREIVPGARRVVLLGDIFHLWFERRGRVVGDYREALQALADAAAGRHGGGPVAIDHVCGNRDFAVGAAPGNAPPPRWEGYFRGRDRDTVSALADAGVVPHGPVFDFEREGLRVRGVHGDDFCRRQPFFQFARWGLTGPIGRAVFWRCPWWTARALYGFLQTRPRRYFYPATEEEKWYNAARFVPEPQREAVAGGIDLIVCGHLHQGFERDIEAPGGRRGKLVSLPAFQDGCYGEMTGGEVVVRELGIPPPTLSPPRGPGGCWRRFVDRRRLNKARRSLERENRETKTEIRNA